MTETDPFTVFAGAGVVLNLDERSNEPVDVVHHSTEGVTCAAVGCGERFGVSIKNAVRLFR